MRTTAHVDMAVVTGQPSPEHSAIVVLDRVGTPLGDARESLTAIPRHVRDHASNQEIA